MCQYSAELLFAIPLLTHSISLSAILLILTTIIMSTPETKVRKSRIRESVLIKVTPKKLAELIGDAEIGVSRKELRALVLSRKSDQVLADAGL